MSVPFKPLADRVLIQQETSEGVSAGGLVIPEAAKAKLFQGTVLRVGPGRISDGNLIGLTVQVDDRVMYGRFAGEEIKIENQKYMLVRESDILGIFE
jgi:chaperonin GroES